jgi:hypothetical protein
MFAMIECNKTYIDLELSLSLWKKKKTHTIESKKSGRERQEEWSLHNVS